MDTVVLEGSISIRAALDAKVRKPIKIFVDESKRDRNLSYIVYLAGSCGAEISKVSGEKIAEITSGKTHGGVCGIFEAERSFSSPQELFEAKDPFILLLDGIEDPFNFGDCIRSAYAAGANGLLIPRRNWLSVTSIVTKSSAGASEFIKTAVVDDFDEVLNLAKQKNISIVAADRKDAISLDEAKLTTPMILAIGGQLRGLSRAVYDQADIRVFISYKNDFRNSLSGAAACAVIAFSVKCQTLD